MFPLAAIGAGLSGIGSLLGIGAGAHQNRLANQIHPEYTPYKESPYAKKELGLALQYFNGGMPGMQQAQQSIAANGANYNNNVQNNATDSAQALSLMALGNGATNNAYTNLATQNAQFKNDALQNLNQGYQSMVSEGDKSFQSMLQKYMMDTNTQNALRGAGMQNIVGGFNSLGSTAIALDQYNKSK